MLGSAYEELRFELDVQGRRVLLHGKAGRVGSLFVEELTALGERPFELQTFVETETEVIFALIGEVLKGVLSLSKRQGKAGLYAWKLSLEGKRAQKGAVRVKLELPGASPRWLVPALFYKHNRTPANVRQFPAYSETPVEGDKYFSSWWEFSIERASHPAVFGWTEQASGVLTTQPTFEVNAHPFQVGLGLGKVAGQPAVWLNFPEREAPLRYALHSPGADMPKLVYLELARDTRFTLQGRFGLGPRDLQSAHPVLKVIYEELAGRQRPKHWVSRTEAQALTAYGLWRWHYDARSAALYETCAFDGYFGEGPGQWDRPHMHVAWVSGLPYAAFLLQYGRKSEQARYVQAGLAVIEKIVTEGIAPCGLFYSQWTREKGWDAGWNPKPDWLQSRTSAEAALFLGRAIEHERALGEVHPTWQRALESNLDFAVKCQREDGNFGSYYNLHTGSVEEWDGCGGLVWVAALAEEARRSGRQDYLEAALKGGEWYEQFLEDQFIYGAPEDVHLSPTSEDGYNAVLAYTALYRATDSEHWLQAALASAYYTVTYRWAYNITFPEHTILAQYDSHTLGADLASSANNHLHNYGLVCLPEFAELYQATGDEYLLQRARDHLDWAHQFIAREDGDFGARKGMVPEQWFNTDWTHAKGSLLALAHSWCAGLILYADMEIESRFAELFPERD